VRWLGWLVGPAAAVATLFLLGIGLSLFASGGGVLFSVALAFMAGTRAAGLVDQRRRDVHALIVAVSIGLSLSTYLKVLQSRPLPPGASYGGANVEPPR
jgi:hypothetical protein